MSTKQEIIDAICQYVDAMNMNPKCVDKIEKGVHMSNYDPFQPFNALPILPPKKT